MTDQHRADALGSVSPWMHTPHLDRLAAGGTQLLNLFAQSPICVPARASLITGRYPHTHRVRQNHTRIDPREPHLFRAFASAGWRTAIVGKNHLFRGQDMAFDIERTRDHALDDPAWIEHVEAIQRDMRRRGLWAGARFDDLPEEGSATNRVGKHAIEALDQLASWRDPFLLWVSFSDPHSPHTAPSRLAPLYPLERMPLFPNELGEGKPTRQAIKRTAQRMHEATEEALRRYVAVYSAMITHVDEQIGRILDRLVALDLDRETIVVFTADHGEFRGEHGLVEKDLLLYDCLLRVPCLIRGPGVEEKKTPALAEQIDLYPTIADLAGVPLPRGIQGRSLVPLLDGRTLAHRSEVHAEVCPPDARNPFPDFDAFVRGWDRAPYNVPGDHLKMIRTPELKYVWSPHGQGELYDLIADPGERRNLAGLEEHRPTTRELEHRLFEWVVRSEDVRDREDDER